jgi:SAM-dependent methyltransferase
MAEPLPDWAPNDVDLTTASAARMYDYYLGGAHNFAVDRELAQKVLQAVPDAPLIAHVNRAFLHRSVRYLAAQGIHQFIDIGSGIPTEGSVHETAAGEAIDPRVLYVDHDPVAVAHSGLILKDSPHARVLQGDLRRPDDILNSPELDQVIDLSRPVAALMVAVLPFIPEADQPDKLIGQFRDRLAPGSYLVISHITAGERKGAMQSAAGVYRSAADSVSLRGRERILELFHGWDLVEPGLVWASQWRPNWSDEVGEDPASSSVYVGVARKA